MYIILRVLKKEFLQLRRDPRMFPILFIAPVIQLVMMGYAATLDIKHIGLAVWDQDRSPQSTELVRRITSTQYFDLKDTADSYDKINRQLVRGEVQAALVIPPGFGRALGRGDSAPVQAVFDGADSNQSLIAQNYLSIIIQMENARIVTQRVNALGPALAAQNPALAAAFERMRGGGLGVAPEPRVFYNPELRSANFMVPGVVVMVLLVITTMLTALAVVREKEVGTMEQVIVTPIKPWQFILGKLAPFVIIGFIEITVILLVAILWFKVPFRGSIFALYAYAAMFLLTTLGLGLFVSSISQNQQQAMMTAFFIMFVMILLSGFMFPIENMPEPVQWLTTVIPMRYFLVIIRSLFLKGSSFLVLWPQALALLIIGIAVIAFSIQRFHKTID